MNIAFLTRAMELGGAELQLALLANGLAKRNHEVSVFTFYPGKRHERLTLDARIRSLVIGKKGRWDVIPFLWRLSRAIRQARPDILHSFLGPPNIAAALCGLGHSIPKIVWGIRASNMDVTRYDWSHAAANGLETLLARRPDLIVANSEAGRRHAIERHLPANRIEVVVNGIDVERFAPRRGEALALRSEWLGSLAGPLIGLVARIDPMKGHPTFLQAAKQFLLERPHACFVCLGDGQPAYVEEMRALADTLGVAHRIRWVGSLDRVELAMNAFDLVTLSSSFGEGFPNTVAEAMACAVPVVGTDVGDVRQIVADVGMAVPPNDPSSLAAAWLGTVAMDPIHRDRLVGRGRQRIVQLYSETAFVGRMEKTYARLCAAGPATSPTDGWTPHS